MFQDAASQATPQAAPEAAPQASSIPQGVNQVSASSQASTRMTNTEIVNFKNSFAGATAQLKAGNNTVNIAVNDLQYSESTGRWRLKSTGNFISNSNIKAMKESLTRNNNASVAMALVAREVIIPEDYSQAMESPEKENWQQAMEEEMQSLKENEVFEILSESQCHRKPVGSIGFLLLSSIEMMILKSIRPEWSQKATLKFTV